MTKRVGRLTVETKCTCKKPDWVTQYSTDELMAKDIFFLQCDACKEYAFDPLTNKYGIELNILVAIPNEERIEEQLATSGTLKTATIEGALFLVLNK